MLDSAFLQTTLADVLVDFFPADMSAVVKNREEDAERLAEEVSENRDDLNRMLDSFRHRERQLQVL